jgi:two-component system response regulator PilR (NtrC family)
MKPPKLAPDAVECLRRYSFPGNVRELENVLERALTLCNGTDITAQDLHLPESEDMAASAEGDGGGESSMLPGSESLDDYLERIERGVIEQALSKTNQNKTAAAKLLGISFRALRYKLEKLGIE